MRSIQLALVFAVTALMSSTTVIRAGETPAGTTRIEEDWELIIANPDLEGAGPQITTCMAPDSDDKSHFVAFNLNYRADPKFIAGGVHILVWKDDEVVDLSANESGRCGTANEHITWTQRMSLSDGSATFAVRDGRSTTWNRFGEEQGLDAVHFATSVETLASYNPDVSASRSGVGWMKNRVTKMTLLRVRYFSKDGPISTDETPRPVVDNTSN